jgi:hypothetical protein
MLPDVQLSAFCLDSLVANATNATVALEPSPYLKAGCNRVREIEEFEVFMDALNYQDINATTCNPFSNATSPEGMPSSVTQVWEEALKQYFTFYDPCDETILELSDIQCTEPNNPARPGDPTIEFIATVRVRSPYPCSGRRFIHDWVGAPATGREGLNEICRSDSCRTQGLGPLVWSKVIDWLNHPSKGVPLRSYTPTETSYMVVRSSPTCASLACQSPLVPVNYCRP